MVEELSSSFCTSCVVSWRFAITWSSLAMRVCPILCPYPPEGVLFGQNPGNWYQASSTKLLYHLKQSYSEAPFSNVNSC